MFDVCDFLLDPSEKVPRHFRQFFRQRQFPISMENEISMVLVIEGIEFAVFHEQCVFDMSK